MLFGREHLVTVATDVPAGSLGAPVQGQAGIGTDTRSRPRLAPGWPATRLDREELLDQLTSGPFVLAHRRQPERRMRGLTWLLDWLEDQPGETWQERWLASGADAAGALAAGADRAG